LARIFDLAIMHVFTMRLQLFEKRRQYRDQIFNK